MSANTGHPVVKIREGLTQTPYSGIAQSKPCERQSLGIVESWSLDEYTEQVGPWDVRLDKVSRGAFHSKMRFLKVPGITLYDERWEHQVLVRGSPPEDLIMIGTNIASGTSDVRWCGQVLNDQTFALSQGRNDIEFVMPDNGYDAVVLIDPQQFHHVLADDVRQQVGNALTTRFSPTDGQHLIQTMVLLLNRYHARPGLLQLKGEKDKVSSQLFAALERCFLGDRPPSDLSASARDRALQLALELAEDSQGRATALQMAQTANVSQRTLEYVFREVIGVTPGRYLALTRLNHCYHDLFHADPKMGSVTDVALAWGFTHLGRFSKAYREHFDELPSETLGKWGRHPREPQLSPF